MIIIALAVLGLCLGSFVNALVWRLHQQAKTNNKPPSKLSILNGRSMCVHCRHTLTAKDLMPVFSWLYLRGHCRYCHKPISWQYPAVELLTSGLFVLSYVTWPYALDGTLLAVAFVVWLGVLTCFVALSIYDIRWMLLPDKIMIWLVPLSAGFYALNVIGQAYTFAPQDLVLSIAILAGLFAVLFFVSSGRWIGFGDVKLALALSFLAQTPLQAFMVLFLASLLGSVFALPSLMMGKLKRSAHIPFGPFLMSATVIVVLFGSKLSAWLSNILFIS